MQHHGYQHVAASAAPIGVPKIVTHVPEYDAVRMHAVRRVVCVGCAGLCPASPPLSHCLVACVCVCAQDLEGDKFIGVYGGACIHVC
jgi:hypothetical protein